MPAVGKCRFLGRCPLFGSALYLRLLSLQLVTRPPNRWSKGVPLCSTTTLVFERFGGGQMHINATSAGWRSEQASQHSRMTPRMTSVMTNVTTRVHDTVNEKVLQGMGLAIAQCSRSIDRARRTE